MEKLQQQSYGSYNSLWFYMPLVCLPATWKLIFIILATSFLQDYGIVVGFLSSEVDHFVNQECHCFFNVNVLFGRGGKPSCNTIIIAEFCHSFTGYVNSVDVTFVCQEDHRDRRSIMQCYFLSQITQPLWDRMKCLGTGYIKHHGCCNCIFVVHSGHVTKPLMPCNVPELKVYLRLLVPLQGFDREVGSNCYLIIWRKLAFRVSADDCRLSNAVISNDQKLEE